MDKLLNTLQQLSSTELDKILDKRDLNPFDSSWCSLNDLIPDPGESLDTKSIFIKLSEITNGHEICSYISDDLELIDRAEKAGIQSEFLNYLKNSYEKGEVPCEWRS